MIGFWYYEVPGHRIFYLPEPFKSILHSKNMAGIQDHWRIEEDQAVLYPPWRERKHFAKINSRSV